MIYFQEIALIKKKIFQTGVCVITIFILTFEKFLEMMTAFKLMRSVKLRSKNHQDISVVTEIFSPMQRSRLLICVAGQVV